MPRYASIPQVGIQWRRLRVVRSICSVRVCQIAPGVVWWPCAKLKFVNHGSVGACTREGLGFAVALAMPPGHIRRR